MEVTIRHAQNLLQIKGRIDTLSVQELENHCREGLDTQKNVIMDLQDCPYISSAGIRVLLKLKKSLAVNKKELFLCAMPADVYQVFLTAGLGQIFQFEPTVAQAEKKSVKDNKPKSQLVEFHLQNNRFQFLTSTDTSLPTRWAGPDIVSFAEMPFGFGTGNINQPSGMEAEAVDFFITTDKCVGFYKLSNPREADFRIVASEQKSAFSVHEAYSFGLHPAGLLKMPDGGSLGFDDLKHAVKVVSKLQGFHEKALFFVAATFDPEQPSIQVFTFLEERFPVGVNPKSGVYGIHLELDELETLQPDHQLRDFLNLNLSYENIAGISDIREIEQLTDPVIWIFSADDFIEGNNARPQIETTTAQRLDPVQGFLTRLLFSDARRLLVDPLHGGFSAQTFHVTSFDADGRKMRPTVMKIAHRDLIERESDRCSRYSLPYIFNNSAVVLGAEFFGDKGALRYNFVGIGGESSKLSWLTNYYEKENFGTLEPLFDKIFLHILKPWYGQPVLKNIRLFEEHDPTATFFPHIYQTVSELFSISAEDQYIWVEEAGRNMLNPYWFLKHGFEKRKESSIRYYTGICHGDLNMQNILLDEHMNVYLIDFSETRPRSVVSDFARLEAIFLVDRAPLDDETDFTDYLNFIMTFYSASDLTDIRPNTYAGKHTEKVNKNHLLALKMRQYAFESAHHQADPVPYYMALLEWVLPIVCYGIPIPQRRMSMIVSSILCEKVMQAVQEHSL